MKTLEALSRILVVCVYLLAAAAVILLRTPIDYPVYVMAAYGFSRGEDVYSWTEADYARAAEALGFSRYAPPYRYPPLAALLVLPGLSFPDRGMGIWVAAQALSALLTAEALARMARDPARRILIRLGVGLLPPFFVSLYAGQINPLVTLGMILAVRWIGRGREGWGGLLLGLSLMLKPLALGPAALCLYEGRRKALAGMVLGIALSLAAGLLAFGPPALGFLRLSLPTSGGVYPPAQNLPGLAARWLTRHPYGFSLADDAGIARGVGWGLAGMLLLLTGIALGRPGKAHPDFVRRAGLAAIAFLLANPGTWYHHGMIMSMPLAAWLAQPGRSPTEWGVLGASVGAIAIWGVAWHAFVGWTPLLDLATLGSLGLWALLAWEIRKESPR
jgi:hypothetical protein